MNIEQKDQSFTTTISVECAHECFDICSNAWGSYINDSLQSLIESGASR
jgi:hypothetical protein